MLPDEKSVNGYQMQILTN